MTVFTIRDEAVQRLVCARGCGRRGVDLYGCANCDPPPLPLLARSRVRTGSASASEIDRGLTALGYDGQGHYMRRHRRVKPSPPIAPIVKRLALRGLRPVEDPVLELVRADCPDCQEGWRDPLGLYRPLAVIPHDGRVILRCDVCGEHCDV